MADSGADAQPLSVKLRQLLDERRKPDGRRYTLDELSAATGLSPSYLKYLLSGQRDNPSKNALQLLATFFSVDPSYFFDVTGDPDLDRITMLARNLPPGAPRAHLRAIVEQVILFDRAAEGRGDDSEPGALNRPE